MGMEENKALVRHMYELANKAQTAIVCFDFCDSNYVEHRQNNVEFSLAEAKQEMIDFPPFTDYSLTVDHLLADGDKVAYSVKHRYTLIETGERFQIISNGIFRIENGKIMEFWGLGGGVTKI